MPCPYRILIGPLFNPDYLGDYQSDPNIRIFKHRNAVEAQPERFHILYDMDKTPSFGRILAQLPPDWEPDVVIWWDAVYQGMPPGIEGCPYPTLLIVGDWNVGALQSLVHAEMFDALLADRSFLQVMERHQLANGLYWPGFSFQPQIHRSLSVDRDIDISFVGNLNSSVHLERSVLLDQVLQLRDRYQVVVSQGLWGDAYVELLNRSKIVFNYSVRGEMNMRAYEAPACGALLFMESSNLEVRDFLTDREHCVLYTPENLHELLVYYLSHDEEREAIAAAGQRQIQAYTYQKQFEQLWALIPTVQFWHRTRPRIYHQRSAAERLLLEARQLFFALSQGSSTLARRLVTHISPLTGPLTWEQAEQLNALSVLLTPALASGSQCSSETDALFVHLHELFGLCHEADPKHPVYLYHQGFMLESRQQWEQAETIYLNVIALLDELGAAEKLYHARFYLLPSPRFRTHNPFPTEWEQACVAVTTTAHSELLGRFKELIWQRLALLRYYLQRWPSALDAYQHLTRVSDRGIFWLWKARVYMALDQPELALNCFQAALARDPFLIAQIGAVFSGADFAEVYPTFRPWVIRYADIFPVVKDYQQLMLFLDAPIADRDEVLAAHYSSRWVQLLSSLQSSLAQGLSSLFTHPVRVAIKGLQAPESPRLLPQAPFLQWVAESQAEVVFERVWDGGAFDRLRFGIKELPCLFEPVSAHHSCEDVGATPYVLLLPDGLSSALCLAVISQFEADFAAQDVQLVLWSPAFTEQAWDILIGQIPENYAAQITILSYALTLEQQQGLFQSAQTVFGGQLNYLWWALWLGARAACLEEQEGVSLSVIGQGSPWDSLKMPRWIPGQPWPHLDTQTDPTLLSQRMQSLYRHHYPHDTLAQFWRWALNWRSGNSAPQ